ncbi:MAG: hypothetical protein IPG89_07365 [Bacteroidetes bacterium]|nr:hypothetical protein [Bacteroidota bacterium]
MKVAINCITIILIFVSQTLFSQIADGNYTYSNNEITFKFSVIENGEKLSNVTIFNSVTKKTSNETGEYRSANNVGWYEVQSAECNYEFDAPVNGKLTLSQFDCKKGSACKKI